MLNNKQKIFLVVALIITAAIRLITLGAYPVMDTTEARYAQIGRAMVVTDDWVTPQFDAGRPFWGKPPLSFWLTALSYKIFGVNTFGARFSSFLLGVLTILLTYVLGLKLENKIVALMAGTILATTGLFFVSAGSVMTDPSLAFCVTLSMAAFVITLKSDKREEKWIWSYLFFVGMGLSLLAKGPVGPVLILMPVIIWMLWHKKWKDVLKEFPWDSGILLSLAIALPWYILMEQKNPGFLKYFIVGEHWQRFTVKGWKGDLYGSGHSHSKGMIWLFSIPSTMPWIVILVPTIIRLFKSRRALEGKSDHLWMSYIFLCYLAPMILFTMAGNILITYVLPGLPAFAVFTAYALHLSKETLNSKIMPWYLSEKAYAIATGFVPVCFLLAVFTFFPGIARWYSQWSVVELFNKLEPDVQGKLIYTKTMPYSADFYAKGRAQEIPDSSAEKILENIHDHKLDFYVIKDEDLNNFPPEALDRTKVVGRFKEYTVRQEINP